MVSKIVSRLVLTTKSESGLYRLVAPSPITYDALTTKDNAMSMFAHTAHEMGIKSNRPKFIRINGRMVRNTNGKEVVINSQAKGNSLAKFPRRIGRIGFHKFA